MALIFDNIQYSTISGYLDALINSDYFLRSKTDMVSGVAHAISNDSIRDGYLSNVNNNNNNNNNTLTTNLTGLSARFYLDTFNNTNAFGSSLRGRRFRGTPEFPSGILQDDTLLQVVGDGYNTSGIVNNQVNMAFRSAENWSTSGNGTYITFRTTPTGSIINGERLRIAYDGNVGIGNNNPQYKLDISGAGNFTDGLYLNNIPILSLISGGNTTVSSSEIYRNNNNQITGIQYDNDFSRIYRNENNKITGIFYNNYFKRILYDNNDSVIGVNVTYY